MRPIFVLSKHMRNNEFLFPPMEAYENATDATALKKYKPWSEKTVNKIFWRGTSTGDSYSEVASDGPAGRGSQGRLVAPRSRVDPGKLGREKAE
jgi:hypothetical protein